MIVQPKTQLVTPKFSGALAQASGNLWLLNQIQYGTELKKEQERQNQAKIQALSARKDLYAPAVVNRYPSGHSASIRFGFDPTTLALWAAAHPFLSWGAQSAATSAVDKGIEALLEDINQHQGIDL